MKPVIIIAIAFVLLIPVVMAHAQYMGNTMGNTTSEELTKWRLQLEERMEKIHMENLRNIENFKSEIDKSLESFDGMNCSLSETPIVCFVTSFNNCNNAILHSIQHSTEGDPIFQTLTILQSDNKMNCNIKYLYDMPIDNHGPEANFTATCRQIILDEYDRFSISQCINESGEILLRSIHIPYPLQNLPVRYDPNSSEHQSKIEKFELFKEKFLAQDPALYNEEPEQKICTAQYDPVCGISDETFSNRCVLESAGDIFDYEGGCVGTESELKRKILCGDGTIDVDGICQVEQSEEKREYTIVDDLHIPRIEKTVDVPEEKPSEKSVNWFSSFFDWLGGLFK